MGYAESIRNFFAAITVLVIGVISFVKLGIIDMHSVYATFCILVPATVTMGLLGHKIGEIMDNPNNSTDADYKSAVLNALKKMDKNVTLQELNDKLTKTVAEPDGELSDSDEDLGL